MRLRLLLAFVSYLVCFGLAACGGKVVLDTTGGTGGAGGTAACTDYCNAVQTANCTSMIPDCSTSCLSSFALGSCQSQLAAALECGAAAITQSGNCSSAMLTASCQDEVNAVANCEASGTGTGGTVGTSGFGGIGAGG